MAAPKYQEQRLVRQPADITFTVRGSRGYLMGSEVSNALMKLTMVEFSYYMGFPVLQIAERKYHRAVSLYSSYFHLLVLSECFLILRLNFSLLEHHFVLLPTAFHYPELNTSQLLRSSWVRTGIKVSVLGTVKKAATTTSI